MEGGEKGKPEDAGFLDVFGIEVFVLDGFLGFLRSFFS